MKVTRFRLEPHEGDGAPLREKAVATYNDVQIQTVNRGELGSGDRFILYSEGPEGNIFMEGGEILWLAGEAEFHGYVDEARHLQRPTGVYRRERWLCHAS